MDVEIRTYELRKDGSLAPLSIVPISHYGGVCPDVGDTLCSNFTALGVCFYSVQRRYFMAVDGANGWAVVLRRLEPAQQHLAIYDAWNADTAFWNEVDERERQEKLQAVLERVKASETARTTKSKPSTGRKDRPRKTEPKTKRR